MELIDLYLYNALVDKIKSQDIKPLLCGVCNPPCKEYKIRLFSKDFTLEITTSDTILIYSFRTIGFPSILCKKEYVDFLNDNPDLIDKLSNHELA